MPLILGFYSKFIDSENVENPINEDKMVIRRRKVNDGLELS